MNSLIEFLNLWGARCLHSALPMLLQASLLIVVLLLLDLTIERYARAVVRYGLWLLVLVKLVLPPSLALPTGIGYWLDTGKQRPVKQTLPATTVLRFSEPIAVEGEPKFSPPPAAPALGLAASGLLAWIAGSVILLGILIRRSRNVARRVAEAAEAPAQLQELLNSCCRQMGIRQTIALKLAGFAMSPAACGLWRPVILIPEELVNKLSLVSLRAVLLHELAHIKRGDVWVNYLQTLLQIVYWYHPLLWLANARIRRVREQAVDEMVMVEMGEDAETYPATLLQVARTCFARARLSLGLVGIVESGSALAERLKRLVNRPTPTTSRLTMTNVLLCLLVGAALLPMAHGQRSDKILISATKVDPKTIEGTAKIDVLPNGEYVFDGQTMLLDQLHSALHKEIHGTRQETQSQNAVDSDSLVSRDFLVDRQAFLQAVQKKLGQLTDINSLESEFKLVKQFFANAGVNFEASSTNIGSSPPELYIVSPQPTQLYVGDFGDQTRILLFRATLQELGKVEKAILGLNLPALPTVNAQDEGAGLRPAGDLREKLAEAEKELESLLRVYKEKWPPVRQQREKIDKLEAQLKAAETTAGGEAQAGSDGAETKKTDDHSDLRANRVPKSVLPLIVTITKDGRFYLGTQPVSPAKLKQELEAAVDRNPRVVVSVRADREAPLYLVVKVLDAAKAANIQSPSLSISPSLSNSTKPRVVTVDARFLALSATTFQKLELGAPSSTDRNEISTWSLSPEQLNAFLRRAEKQPGFQILGAPKITTNDGQEAALYMGHVMQSAIPGTPQRSSEPIEENGGPIFSVNAIGYVTVLGTNSNGELSPVSNLIGPAVKILPRVVGSAIDVVVNAQVTEAVLNGERGNKRATSAVRRDIRTNFLAETRVLIPDSGTVVIANRNFEDAKGDNVLFLLSATFSEADSSNGSSPK